jgi:hypothetical protein
MLKIILSFIFLINFSAVFAQSNKEISHLEFLGIPITGELDDFVSKVLEKNRGFEVTRKHTNDFRGFTSTELNGGKFWKFNDCSMFVRYNNDVELVTSILVNYKKAQEQDYEDIILSFDKKYGEHDDKNKENGLLKYMWWVENNGRIIVTIAKKYSLISIKYEDFPETCIEAEKEIKKLLYEGYVEDSDL